MSESALAGLISPLVTETAQEPTGVCGVAVDVSQSPLAADPDVLARRFKALADPNRLRILAIVSSNAEAETCVCDISEPLALGQSTVSHHLRILVQAGLLDREKRGVWAYYSVVPGALQFLADALHEVVPAGREMELLAGRRVIGQKEWMES